MVAIQVRNVTKVFQAGRSEEVRALNGVSFDLADGQALALVGPSGSGKSTLLHLVAALETPSSGTVEVNGTDVGALKGKALSDYRRRLGFVFQRFNLIPTLNALDNVLAPVIPFRTTFDKQARGRELLAAVGLEGRASTPPTRLSGGQQQRVAIARALINHPTLVLADEPTGALDSVTGAEVMELLGELRIALGMTLIVATHDYAIASRCDRIISLKDGVIVADDDLAPPADPMLTQARIGSLKGGD